MMISSWKSTFIALTCMVFSSLSGNVFADAVGELDSEEQRQAVCENATEASGKEVSREINIARTVANCVGGGDSADTKKKPKARRSSGSGEAAQ